MKIYFSAAIFQKEKFGDSYQKIVDSLKNEGHTVLQDTVETSLKEAVEKTDIERVAYYKQVLKWIATSDAVVVEVSFPSTLHIGHEITLALEKGKPVIGLYKKGFEPSFFLGLEQDKLIWVEYDEASLEKDIKYALDMAANIMDTRFNFFISPRHQNFLDWISKTKKIPRAVFLRNLIEEEMEKDDEYAA